jgi:hypothetical protein
MRRASGRERVNMGQMETGTKPLRVRKSNHLVAPEFHEGGTFSRQVTPNNGTPLGSRIRVHSRKRPYFPPLVASKPRRRRITSRSAATSFQPFQAIPTCSGGRGAGPRSALCNSRASNWIKLDQPGENAKLKTPNPKLARLHRSESKRSEPKKLLLPPRPPALAPQPLATVSTLDFRLWTLDSLGSVEPSRTQSR